MINPNSNDSNQNPFDAPKPAKSKMTRKLRDLSPSAIVGLSAGAGAVLVLGLSLAGSWFASSLPGQVEESSVQEPVIAPQSAQVEVVPQPGNATTIAPVSDEVNSSEAGLDAEVLKLRRREDALIAERQKLEDQKRQLERELENKQIEDKRLQEDKALLEQRRADQQRIEEARREEDRRLAEQAEQELQRKIEEERQAEERKREEEKIAAAPGTFQ